MIGPIPAIPTGDATPWMDCDTAAPTRPVWGGYLPVQARDGGDWRADTTETRLHLHLRDGAWYVERPARPCCRAVVIAADAIRDGAEPPPGILPEEVEKAREILASDDPRAWAWAASGGWGLLEWPLPATEPSDAEEVVSRRGDPGYYDDDI